MSSGEGRREICSSEEEGSEVGETSCWCVGDDGGVLEAEVLLLAVGRERSWAILEGVVGLWKLQGCVRGSAVHLYAFIQPGGEDTWTRWYKIMWFPLDKFDLNI